MTASFGLLTSSVLLVHVTGSYCQRMIDGRLPNVVRDAAGDSRVRDLVRDLAVTADLGIGSYIGVPLDLPGGEHYGVLCCLRKGASDDLDQRDVEFLEMLAQVAAEQLEDARNRFTPPAILDASGRR